MKHKVRKFFLTLVFLALASMYVIKFGGPALLKLYVRSGMGGCDQQQIFCLFPGAPLVNPPIDQEFVQQLKVYNFPDFSIALPKELKAIQGEITRVYYKKRPWKMSGSVAYLLYREPGFFCRTFPQAVKLGVMNDYEFVSQVMNARLGKISTLSDAFFVIMKSLFTPDLGEQKTVRIHSFTLGSKKGFISYNLEKDAHYFDCNFFDGQLRYYKVYIKDKKAILDIPQILAIISTVKASQ